MDRLLRLEIYYPKGFLMKYTTLQELREANRKRALKYYNKVKDDPEYKALRKKRDKERYEKRKKKNQS